MIKEFESFSHEQVELLLKAPILVSILIAGADDEIDKSEIKKAINIAQDKQKRARAALIDYYKEVGENFEDKLMVMIQSYPSDSKTRNPQIIEELEELNDLLPKLDKHFAVELYESLKDIAKKIAEASGGVLGYMSIGYEESKLIGLNMLDDPSK